MRNVLDYFAAVEVLNNSSKNNNANFCLFFNIMSSKLFLMQQI